MGDLERREPSPTSQAGRILEQLRAGLAITPFAALRMFRCFRLAARIAELRRLGWNIETERVQSGTGKSFARYRLAP